MTTTNSFPTVNAAVSKIVLDAKLKTVDELLAFIQSEVEIELKGPFEKFKAQIKASHKEIPEKKKKGDGDKPKRKASLFNIYVREKMVEIKAQNPDVKGGAMKLASESWNSDPFAVF